MDTQLQIDRLVELALIQRKELKALVEQLPSLRQFLSDEIEKNMEEVEPQIRAELEAFCVKRATDESEKLGKELAARVDKMLADVILKTQVRYAALANERTKNADLVKQAEEKIAAHADTLPNTVKGLVEVELARFPRAGEIDQLRKEFAEPRGLNPRGKWASGQTYNRLDLVSFNGDSFVSSIDGNTEKPNRNSGNWTLSAARGAYGGGGGITSLIDLYNKPNAGQVLIGTGKDYTNANLTAGDGIAITNGVGSITISANGGVNYQGTWNASTNTPALTSSVGTKGYYYVVSVAGSTNLNGVTDWEVGDWAVFNGTAWQKIDNTDKVSSVFGRTGAVTAVSTDYSGVGITNTAIGASNPSTGAFTTLSATGNATAAGVLSNGNVSGQSYAIGATTSGATRLDLISTAANGKDWYLNSYSDGNFYIGEVGGADRLTIAKSTGNATFAGNLTVSGGTTSITSNSTLLKFEAVTDTNYNTKLENFYSAGLSFQMSTLNSPWLKILTNGTLLSLSPAGSHNVLIGTTTDYAGRLQVASSGSDTALFYRATGRSRISINGISGSSEIGFGDGTTVNAASVWVAGRYNSDNSFRFAASNDLNTSVAMTLGTSGNVGIGTSTDNGFRLRVLGGNDSQLYLDCAAGVQYTSMYWANGGTQKAQAYFNNTANKFVVGPITAGSSLVLTSGPNYDALTFDGSQNATFGGKVTLPATGYFAQNASPAANYAAQFCATLSGSVNQYGLVVQPTTSNSPTTGITALLAQFISPNSSFTTTNAYTLYAAAPIKGASHTITNNYGLYVESMTAGSNNYAIYTAGTAPSVLGGNLTVSGTVSTFGGTGNTELKLTSSTSGVRPYGFYIDTVGNWNLYDYTAAAVRMAVASSGNLLIGTTTDSSNGKLQLATHTTSAGGIGFGTDTSLYRTAAGRLAITSSSDPYLYFYAGASEQGKIAGSAGNLFVDGPSGGGLYLRTSGGNNALTLDSSQNATFAGRIGLTASGSNTIYSNFIPADGGTFAGRIVMQAGGGSASYGGGIAMYGPSHATKAGWISLGISATTGAKFAVNSYGTSDGTDVFTIDTSGNQFIKNTASVPSSNPTGGGYFYVESGALKYRGSSGTVTTIAAA